MTPGEIERDHDHDEKESVTNNASNNAPKPFTHSSSSRLYIQTACIGYFPVCLISFATEPPASAPLISTPDFHSLEAAQTGYTTLTLQMVAQPGKPIRPPTDDPS